MNEKVKSLMEKYESCDVDLINFLKKIGVKLKEDLNIPLLKAAFTHKSFSNDVHKKVPSNERLEFLGDAILGFIISDFLYHEKDQLGEDLMSLYKIALVNEQILAEVAREIDAGKYILLGFGEINSNGADKDSVLSDFIEALIAYIYLDLGEEQARIFIKKYIYSKFDYLKKNATIKNPKSMLQEFIQKKYKLIPQYIDYEQEIDEKGNPILYKAEVYVKEEKIGEGSGTNKKKAEIAAAKDALKNLGVL